MMRALQRELLIGIGLAVLVLAAHGFSLEADLFLDDHAHFAQLRESDWSFRSAVDSARLGIVGDVMDLWGRKVVGLRFFRPVAFWILRIEYTIADWNPVWMHAFSLGWHALVGLLVTHLAYCLLARWAWAFAAGAWFVVHPGHVLTVSWIACQTELMVTAFSIAAVLCYAKSAGWLAGPPLADGRRASRWLRAAAITFFALALGCRENAVIVPMLIVGGDFLLGHGPVRRRGAWGTYAILAGVGSAYLLVRYTMLGGFPVPAAPYLHDPTDPAFLSFAVIKSLYYLLGLFTYLPIIPIGGVAYLREHPVFLLTSLAFFAVPTLLAVVALRGHRGIRFGGLWVLLGIGVMLPVFASPHHLYLPGVGAAVFFAAGLGRLAGALTSRGPAPLASADTLVSVHGRRSTLAGGVLGLHIVLLSLCSIVFGWAYRTAIAVEHETVRQLQASGRRLREGDHLFFINFPMLAYYATMSLENRLGLHDLHGHVLTLSPSVLGMDRPCVVEQLDAHTLTIAVERPGYFAGQAGLAIRQIIGRDRAFESGDRIEGPWFDTTILEADDQGVTKLQVRFRRPLDDPAFHVYIGSRARFAYPLALTSGSQSHGPAD